MRIFPSFALMTAETADLGRLVKARLFDGKALGLIAGDANGKCFVELDGHEASFPEMFRIKTDFSVAAFTGLLELRIVPGSS